MNRYRKLEIAEYNKAYEAGLIPKTSHEKVIRTPSQVKSVENTVRLILLQRKKEKQQAKQEFQNRAYNEKINAGMARIYSFISRAWITELP